MKTNLESEILDYRPRTALTYRLDSTRLWLKLHPESRPISTLSDLTLPRLAEQKKVLSGRTVDVIGVTLVSEDCVPVLLLCPPGWGKTTVASKLSGLVMEIDYQIRGALLLSQKEHAHYRVFNSDFVWVGVRDGCLCLLRPEGERLVFLWDISRTISRQLIGHDGFDRERLLPRTQRLQARVFRSLVVQEPFSILYPYNTCLPAVVLVPHASRLAKTCRADVLTRSSALKTLQRAFFRQSYYEKSEFWGAKKEALRTRINDLLRSIKSLPVVYGLACPPRATPAQRASCIEDALTDYRHRLKLRDQGPRHCKSYGKP